MSDMSGWQKALDIERIIVLDDRMSKLVKIDKDFTSMIGDDKELTKKIIDKIGQEAWTWFCDISNLKKFVMIDLKKKKEKKQP